MLLSIPVRHASLLAVAACVNVDAAETIFNQPSVVTHGVGLTTKIEPGSQSLTQLVQVTTVGLSTVTVFSNGSTAGNFTAVVTPDATSGISVSTSSGPNSFVTDVNTAVNASSASPTNTSTTMSASMSTSTSMMDMTMTMPMPMPTSTTDQGSGKTGSAQPATTSSKNSGAIETGNVVDRSVAAAAFGFLVMVLAI
ncbi:hypothetical protein QBC46DRAFT_354356 [Diplogelasinospora grovesii]|uniref:GPI anchored protein n=1 Tax=Diplogelasinospora grovesii TaxID=303347 RepID=A0AAN6N871_9PEZI|nr:hypothetical protein QBC46DRAFT_354356 [Diplogelasinospora grovesii]